MSDPEARRAVNEALDRLALHYENLPYSELEKLADLPWEELPTHEEQIGDHVIELSPMFTGVGGRHQRIAVEIFGYADGSDKCRGLRYFERYASGRIERFDRFTWKDALLFLFLGGGAIATLAWVIRWVWRLF